MRSARVWRALLGVEKAVIEDLEFDEDEQLLIARVRPSRRARGRCGICVRPARGTTAGTAGGGGGRWTSA